MGGAKPADAAGNAGGRARGIEDFQRADRRHHDRKAQFAAEYLGRGIDARDVAQYPRPECDLVKRHPVAAHRGFGLGGADDIIPGILVEVGAGFFHKLMKVLERLGAGAKFGTGRDTGDFVHFFLLVFPTAPGLEHPFLASAAPQAKPFSAYQECPARGVSVATKAGHSEIHYFAFDAMTDIARASRLATIFAMVAANFLK